MQWTLGALSNDPVQCSRLAGLFKGTTSLGMCISFVLDSQNVAYIDQLAVQFTLYAVGLAFLLGIIWFCVKDTNYFLEENVIVPIRESPIIHPRCTGSKSSRVGGESKN